MARQSKPLLRAGVVVMRAVSFVGWSGSGKTTLIERLVPLLRARGLSVGYLKADAHGFDMDREGKDTHRIFSTGAERVAIAGPGEGALRFRLDRRDPLALLREHFPGCDFVLVEGFKSSPALPKIEVRRREPDRPPALEPGDPTLRAVVADFEDGRPVPRFAPGDIEAIADFVLGLRDSAVSL